MAPSLLVLVLSCLLLRPSSAANRLDPDQSITSNQTLSSGSGSFVLGFFSPSNDSSVSYLGTWRSGSDVRTAIWVANREAPLPISRAIFRLSISSNLEVADSNGTVLWSSDSNPPDPESTYAVLLDTGDLQIRRGRGSGGTTLWRAFDHATDTVLPDMPIWVNYKTHIAATATSWRSPVDPSPGEFHLSIDPDTPLQGIIRRGSRKWWRGNVWNGVSFTQIIPGNSTTLPFLAFRLDANSWNLSFTSSVQSGAISVRLEHNGTGILRIWSSTTKNWLTYYAFTGRPCESYGLCGAYGYCSSEQPTCRCLDGFEPRNKSEWDGGDYKGGCARKYALTCDVNDQFTKFQKMKLPDYNVYLRNARNGSACVEACRSNCSCVAYSYSDLWTGSESLPRCLVWVGGELLDLVAQSDLTGEDLYVRIHIPDSGNKKKTGKVVVVVSIVAGLAVMALVICSLLWRICRKRRRDSRKNVEVTELTSVDRVEHHQDVDVYGGREMDLRGLPLLDYGVVEAATGNFREGNIIGRGGFGVVYKGVLPRGPEVAVKRLSEDSHQGMVEFKNEVVLIAQLQHRNLVKLLNCCIRREERLLIYEYMPNKSLELLLFNSENQWLLDWGKRLNIVKGIARGLLYLHEDSRLKIIHRDLKASNILLDGEMNPKISDFGMARIFGGGQNQANTKRVVGTYGYISPEYAMEGSFSVKSDVYSFGVLLLEITSGKKNTSFQPTSRYRSLLSYAWDLWKNGDLMELVAHSVRDSCSNIEEVAKCVHIGLLCVQDDPIQRPNMSSVVFMLENETSITSVPEKPVFTGWTCQDDSTRRSPNFESSSVNNLSASVLVGR